jgi:hypothetical protein
MATITVVPASPRAVIDACRVEVASAEDNRTPNNTGGEFRYYLEFVLGGAQRGKSYEFNVSADGDHEFNSFIFDTAGSWTVNLKDAVGDGTVATTSVTVQ